ncbi:MAG: Pvc16 family protein [Heteroscytonema crispum UTEX LB 1556]
MSNSLAIAAVTTTLRNIITPGILNELGSGTVTAKPPDKAREPGDNGNQINIFLYQVLPNGSLRNMDLPNRVKPGEIGQPPLALNLYYLITAYGKDNDDILAHRLLGKAMQILHDFAVLNPSDIKTALAESDLHNQLERVRITLQPMSTEEVSKLWATFQTQYRISASYELSVVLIDSSRPVKTPLPVLTRGLGDQGVFAQADMTPPFPTLEAVQPPNQQPSVRLGEVFTLKGHHLDSDDGRVVVLLMHPRFIAPKTLSLQQQSSDTEISVQIPNQPENFPAGFYTVAVRLQRDGKEQTTNALPFSLAPKIQEIRLSDRILTLNCTPQIWREQPLALLLGEREFLLLTTSEETSGTEKTDTLRFNVGNIPDGEYFVRLRVDGTDSLLIDRSVKPPVFDLTQKVRLP